MFVLVLGVFLLSKYFCEKADVKSKSNEYIFEGKEPDLRMLRKEGDSVTFLERIVHPETNETELVKGRISRDSFFALVREADSSYGDDLLFNNVGFDAEFVLEVLRRSEFTSEHISLLRFNTELWETEFFVKEALFIDQSGFEFVSGNLREKKDIVLLAVNDSSCRNMWNLDFVNEELRNDFDIIHTAVSSCGYTINYASDRLKKNNDILKAAHESYVSLWKRKTQNWENPVMPHMHVFYEGSFWTPKKLDDGTYDLESINNKLHYSNLFYVSRRTESEDHFEKQVSAFLQVYPELNYVKELASIFLMLNPKSLEKMSWLLRRDTKLIMKNFECNDNFYCGSFGIPVGETRVFNLVMNADKKILGQFSEEDCEADFIKKAAQITPLVLETVISCPAVFGDRDFMFSMVEKRPLSLKFVSDELKNDKELVMKAVEQDGLTLFFASDEIKKNRDVALTAVKQNRWAFEFLPWKVRDSDIDIREAYYGSLFFVKKYERAQVFRSSCIMLCVACSVIFLIIGCKWGYFIGARDAGEKGKRE